MFTKRINNFTIRNRITWTFSNCRKRARRNKRQKLKYGNPFGQRHGDGFWLQKARSNALAPVFGA